MSTPIVIIIIVVFLALDLIFYYLIIRAMDKPSPSVALARARGFSLIPDSEAESVGIRLREHLPIGRGDLYDIVRLPLPAGEGYLFSTLPEADSHLPRTQGNRRQFIGVLMEIPIGGGLFIHPPFRPPFGGFKGRRLLRVFKVGAYLPVSADRLPPEIAAHFRVRIEGERVDPARVLTAEVTDVIGRAPRGRGFALQICPGGFVVYINPLLTGELEAGKFYDFVKGLAGAFPKVH